MTRVRHNQVSDSNYSLIFSQVNDGIRNTVLNGITANKLTNKYQCIANVGEETLRKLNVTFERIPKVSDELKDKSIVPLRPYTVFLPGLEASLNGKKNRGSANVLEKFQKKKKRKLKFALFFVTDYMEIKAEEIREGTTEDEINSILEDVSKKMESLEEVLSTIDAKIDEAKYKFFEEYVDFTYATENSLRKDHLDGIKKIKKCIS